MSEAMFVASSRGRFSTGSPLCKRQALRLPSLHIRSHHPLTDSSIDCINAKFDPAICKGVDSDARLDTSGIVTVKDVAVCKHVLATTLFLVVLVLAVMETQVLIIRAVTAVSLAALPLTRHICGLVRCCPRGKYVLLRIFRIAQPRNH